MISSRNPRLNTLLLLLVPMLASVVGLRLYLHLVDHQVDVRVAGYEVHHLYSGTLLLIPGSYILALASRRPLFRGGALVMVGVGSGLILDELVYLIVTDGTNDSYLTTPSLVGAVVGVGVATGLLVGLYLLGEKDMGAGRPEH